MSYDDLQHSPDIFNCSSFPHHYNYYWYIMENKSLVVHEGSLTNTDELYSQKDLILGKSSLI